jgi:hypothetical protein
MELSKDLSSVSDRLNGRSHFKNLPGQKTQTVRIPPILRAPPQVSLSLATSVSTSTSTDISSLSFPAADTKLSCLFAAAILPREVTLHEQPPRVFVAFLDALSPTCVSRSRPAAPAPASLSLLE